MRLASNQIAFPADFPSFSPVGVVRRGTVRPYAEADPSLEAASVSVVSAELVVVLV